MNRHIFQLLLFFIPFVAHGWTTPIQVSGGGINFDHTEAASVSGSVEVAWTTGTYPSLSIRSSTYSGGSFSVPVDVSGTAVCGHAQVGVDDLGNAVLVWSELVGSDFVIQAATKPAESSWSSPSSISATTRGHRPSLAMNGSAEVIAGWIDHGNNQIEVAHLAFGGAWSAVTVISNTSSVKDNLSIGIDASGNGYALWNEPESGSVYAANYDGVSWSAPVVLSDTGNNDYPVLAVDPGGGAVAAWTNLNLNELRASDYSGGSWYEFPIIIADHVKHQTSVATLSDKTCFVMQEDENNSLRGVFSLSDDWQIPSHVIATLPENQQQSVIIDSTDVAFITWVSKENKDVEVVEWPNGGSPGSPVSISSTGDFLLPRAVTNGTLVSVVWESWENGEFLIFANVD